MGDLYFDWNDSSMSLDGTNNGIPIPRSQHSQPYIRADFGGQSYIYDNDSLSPSRPPLVPPNSLVMNVNNISNQFNLLLENQRTAFSPFNSDGSPLMSSSHIDLDMEIKMEPLDELLDIGSMMQARKANPPEDNLLDNVNFEDLLMTDDMDSSTTCLDPQHSSPAAMATVHPDEVFGMMRNDSYSSHGSQSFTPSISVPVKTENVSFGGLAISFPPQGIGWKDTSENEAQFQTAVNSPSQNQTRSFPTKETPVTNHSSSRLFILQDEFAQHNSHQRTDDQLNPTYNNNGSLYAQLESASSATNSTLHDLLVNSPPPPSHSPHQQQQQPQQLSPHSTNNISPISPIRGLSQAIPVGQSVPGAPSFLMATTSNVSSRLSSSAPVNDFSFEQIWQRREPRQHLLSTGSLAEEVGGSTSSLSTGGGILSPIPPDLSIDDCIDSDDDSDVEHYDSDSDNDSIMSEDMSSMGSHSGKKERHFWQYNVQAKGPKGHRVNITHNETNPHRLDKIMDPVFSPLCSIQGIKHSGKARRGDGNDLTPSPRKLVSIGVELSKLNKKITDMTPVNELPSTVRTKSRKEKNKLASRACRLKKKAQHEANKIKLYGLEQEHKGMMTLIAKVKDELIKKVYVANAASDSGEKDDFFHGFGGSEATQDVRSNDESIAQLQQFLSNYIERAAKMRTKQHIAGFTTEFVNKVIENCRNGNPTGGLDELAQTFVKTTSSPVNEAGSLNYNNELYT